MFASRAGKILPWLIIAFASYTYIALGFLNEIHLRNGFDLGTYHQILYNISTGRFFPFNSLQGQPAWGDHAHLVLTLFAPIYWLFPSVKTVIAIQVLSITTSAWALFAIAQDKVKNYLFSLAVLLSYLLFFGVQYALDFDFHTNGLTAAAFAWSLYALHFKKWPLYWLTFTLGLLTREDAATFYVMLAVYLLIFHWRRQWRVALTTLALSLLYFYVIGYVLMPTWSGDHALAYFDVYGDSRSPAAVVLDILKNPLTTWQNVIEHPIKQRTLHSLVKSFGYLPLASPFSYLVAAPNLIARFLSSEEQRYMMKFHYSVSLVSILSYGSILGTALIMRIVNDVKKKFPYFPLIRHARRTGVGRQGVINFTISSLCALALLWGTYSVSVRDSDLPINAKLLNPKYTAAEHQPRQAYAMLQLVKTLIPEGATVSANSALVPSLSGRQRIYNFPDHINDNPDWIVLTNQFSSWPLDKPENVSYIRQYKENPAYKEVWGAYGIYAFEKRPE